MCALIKSCQIYVWSSSPLAIKRLFSNQNLYWDCIEEQMRFTPSLQGQVKSLDLIYYQLRVTCKELYVLVKCAKLHGCSSIFLHWPQSKFEHLPHTPQNLTWEFPQYLKLPHHMPHDHPKTNSYILPLKVLWWVVPIWVYVKTTPSGCNSPHLPANAQYKPLLQGTSSSHISTSSWSSIIFTQQQHPPAHFCVRISVWHSKRPTLRSYLHQLSLLVLFSDILFEDAGTF